MECKDGFVVFLWGVLFSLTIVGLVIGVPMIIIGSIGMVGCNCEEAEDCYNIFAEYD